MRLIEVVVEGIPGTRGLLRYPFEPGLNAWKQKGTLRLETIVSLLESLLYPVSDQGMPLGPGRAQKAGITFEANNITYRLIRDYGSKSLKLSQLQPGSKDQYRDLSSDARFITATLFRSVKIPSRRTFGTLLVSTPGKTRSYETISGKYDIADTMPKPKIDPRERLAMLKQEQKHLAELHTVETELDHLQRRVFEIDEILRKLDEPRNKLAQSKADYEPYRIFDAAGLVTSQIRNRLKSHPLLMDKKIADLAALDEKAKSWNEELEFTPERPFWNEMPVFVGAAIALVSFIASTFYRQWVLPLMGLLAVGLGAIVWGVMRGMRREEHLAQLRKDIRGLDGEKAGIEKRFEIEASAIRKFCETVGMNDTNEILDMLERRESALTERTKAESEMKEALTSVPEEDLSKERNETREKIMRLEDKLRTLPNVSVDPNAIESEIRELEEQISSNFPPKARETSPGTSAAQDEIQSALVLASEILERPPGKILRQLQAALSANISTMTAKKVTGLEIQGDQITGFRLNDGSSFPFRAADPATQQALLFGVQFTIWQLIAGEKPLPFILDLVSTSPPDGVSRLMTAAAAHLAKKAQVLILTP